jgi:outer membrane protein OmpA-like peptidoglycan-associated protein
MEQASPTSGSPAGRVGQVMSTQKEDQNQKERQFGLKEIGILVAVTATLVGLVAYGVSSQGTRATSRMTSIADTATPTPMGEASSATAVAQPVQVSTVPPTTNHEPTPAEPARGSKHTDIYFDFGKSRLRADATAILQQHAGALKNDGNWAVLIQGYADKHGPAEYNRTLAMRRAESVRQFLVELGVPESFMKVVSLGKDSTICDIQSPTCQRLNRRVHVEMIKLEAEAVPPSGATTMEETTDLRSASDHSAATPDSQGNEEPTANPTDQP